MKRVFKLVEKYFFIIILIAVFIAIIIPNSFNWVLEEFMGINIINILLGIILFAGLRSETPVTQTQFVSSERSLDKRDSNAKNHDLFLQEFSKEFLLLLFRKSIFSFNSKNLLLMIM